MAYGTMSTAPALAAGLAFPAAYSRSAIAEFAMNAFEEFVRGMGAPVPGGISGREVLPSG